MMSKLNIFTALNMGVYTQEVLIYFYEKLVNQKLNVVRKSCLGILDLYKYKQMEPAWCLDALRTGSTEISGCSLNTYKMLTKILTEV